MSLPRRKKYKFLSIREYLKQSSRQSSKQSSIKLGLHELLHIKLEGETIYFEGKADINSLFLECKKDKDFREFEKQF